MFPLSRLQLMLLLPLCMTVTGAIAQSELRTQLESPVCENGEEDSIDTFQSIATPWFNDLFSFKPKVSSGFLVEPYLFTNTSDQRKLQAYKLRKETSDPSQPVKRLLFIQGNAMFAGNVVFHAEKFAESGFEVHMMEFRGYGFKNLKSDGKAFLQAVVSDFQLLAQELSKDAPLYLYGVSFGGVVVMNTLAGKIKAERVAIDSVPSDLSCPIDYRCASKWWPVNHVPARANNILLIAGSGDPVVKPTCSSALAKKIEEGGGCFVLGRDWVHPLRSERDEHRAQRTQVLLNFLLDGGQPCPKG